MTTKTEAWLRAQFKDEASSIEQPPDLQPEAIRRSRTERRQASIVRSTMAVGVAAALAAVVVITFEAWDERSPVTPVADPPAPTVPASTSDAARTLLGTWEVKEMRGYTPPKRPQRKSGPLATFQTDGTWQGSDGCNNFDGRYAVGPSGEFESTTRSRTLRRCEDMENISFPADGAVEVLVQGRRAEFLDATGEQVATFVRPGGPLRPTARLVERRGETALALTTYGSGSCPNRIISISLQPHNQLIVGLTDEFLGPCTLNLTPSTDVRAVPNGLDLQDPVTATLSGPGGPYLTLLVDPSTEVIDD